MSARTVPLHVRVSPETHKAVHAMAIDEQRPVASMLALLVEDGLRVRKPIALLDVTLPAVAPQTPAISAVENVTPRWKKGHKP